MINAQVAKLFGTLTLDDRDFQSKMNIVEQRLQKLRKGIPVLKVRLDLGASSQQLKTILDLVNKIGKGFKGQFNISNLTSAQRAFASMARSSSRIRSATGGAGARNPLAFGAGTGGLAGFGTGLFIGAGGQFALNPAMAAGILGGRGALGGIRSGIRTQSSIVDIGRVGELRSQSQIDAVREGLFGIGRNIGVDQERIFGFAAGAARQGIQDPEELIKFTEGVARVGRIITDIGDEQLATSLSRLVRFFDLGIENITGLGSAIAKLDETSTASASSIVNLSTRLGRTAANLGLTLPESLAISTAALEGGLRPELASTAIIRILSNLQTDPASFAGALGLDPQEFARTLREDPLEGFRAIRSGIEGAADEGRAASFIREDLGFSNIRDFQTLLNSVIDKLGEFTEQAEREIKTQEALNRADEILSKTAQDNLTRLGNAFGELADAFSRSGVIGNLTEFANQLRATINAISDSQSEGNRSPASQAARGLFGVAGNALNALLGGAPAQNLDEARGFSRNVGGTGDAIATLAGVSANPLLARGAVSTGANLASAVRAGGTTTARGGRLGGPLIAAASVAASAFADIRRSAIAADIINRDTEELNKQIDNVRSIAERREEILANDRSVQAGRRLLADQGLTQEQRSRIETEISFARGFAQRVAEIEASGTDLSPQLQGFLDSGAIVPRLDPAQFARQAEEERQAELAARPQGPISGIGALAGGGIAGVLGDLASRVVDRAAAATPAVQPETFRSQFVAIDDIRRKIQEDALSTGEVQKEELGVLKEIRDAIRAQTNERNSDIAAAILSSAGIF